MSAVSVSGKDLLTVEVTLPNRFDMTPQSVAGRLAALTFYTDGPSRESMAEVLGGLQGFLAGGEKDALMRERVLFQTPNGPREIEFDISGNNQLLGACRALGEFSCGYEPDVACAMAVLTQPDATIIDAGANWGPLSVQHALRPEFRGRIHAFEPQAKAFVMLEKIVRELGLSERIFPQRSALSDVVGEALLSSEVWSGNVFVTQDGNGERCPMAPLDTLLPDVSPDFIKIDVEGFENKVIAGARSMIERAKPHVVFEDWQRNDKQHFGLLADMGYRFYYIGWYDPFQDLVFEKPPFAGSRQLLAFKAFEPHDRTTLPDRVNVLATARNLSLG